MKEADSPEKCKPNTRQEIATTEKHYTNTDGSKFENEDKQMVNDTDNNYIKYFFVYIYHSFILLLEHWLFLFDRTYQLLKHKLSCSTEHFISSENNQALLHFYSLLS